MTEPGEVAALNRPGFSGVSCVRYDKESGFRWGSWYHLRMSDWHSCYDLAESDEHLANLKLAHNLPDDATSMGYPTPTEELERIWEALDEDFARLPVDDQVGYLIALPVDEAAEVLERASEPLRDRLYRLLPPDHRRFLARRWKAEARAQLSA